MKLTKPNKNIMGKGHHLLQIHRLLTSLRICSPTTVKALRNCRKELEHIQNSSCGASSSSSTSTRTSSDLKIRGVLRTPSSGHSNAFTYHTYHNIVCDANVNFHEQDMSLINTLLYLDEFLSSCDGVGGHHEGVGDLQEISGEVAGGIGGFSGEIAGGIGGKGEDFIINT